MKSKIMFVVVLAIIMVAVPAYFIINQLLPPNNGVNGEVLLSGQITYPNINWPTHKVNLTFVDKSNNDSYKTTLDHAGNYSIYLYNKHTYHVTYYYTKPIFNPPLGSPESTLETIDYGDITINTMTGNNTQTHDFIKE